MMRLRDNPFSMVPEDTDSVPLRAAEHAGRFATKLSTGRRKQKRRHER